MELVSLDDERAKQEAFKTLLPLYSLRAAAGRFGVGQAVDQEGWVDAGEVGKLTDKMFVARVVGRSMEPMIYDGDYVVFRSGLTGAMEGKTVLVQYKQTVDSVADAEYTVKRYTSQRTNGQKQSRVVLQPVNAEHEPIVIPPDRLNELRVLAEVVAVLGRQDK